MKAREWKQAIRDGEFYRTFSRLYSANPDVIERQKERYIDAIGCFEETFGGGRNIEIYSTPGRTEIGGNHTDHNNGLVMAGAVNLDIIAVVAKNNDGFIRVQSKGFSETDSVDITYLEPVTQEYGRSAALIRGVAAGIRKRGGFVNGFDAYTTSDVLKGSGLSSSAAFEVCIGAILNGEYNQGRFTPVELGLIGQFAENKYFGKPSGLMDQTACSVGGAITIDLKDPAAPVVEEIAFDLNALGYQLVITDTKGDHADLTDDYAAVRHEMESVAAFFGKSVLREVEPAPFWGRIAEVRAKTGDRAVLRAIHFFEECRRVPLLAEALRENRFEAFLSLIVEGGHSSFECNQNAYSIRHPEEQGVPLALALSQRVLAGKGAWRLQGGGFAGTIQAFVPRDVLGKYCEALEGVFGKGACYVLDIRRDGAVRVEREMD